MFSSGFRRALATLLVAGSCALLPAQSGSERLPYQAARFYRWVKQPHPGELKWQQIPWLVDLEQGIHVAREENRPLVLFVSGDDPLEKC
jgi:hypothetical protein